MYATPVESSVSITTPYIAMPNSKLARIEMAALCAAFYKQHGLPMVFRLTSLCPEDGLSTQLQTLGFERSGETRVMIRALNKNCAIAHTTRIEAVDVEKFV